MNKESKLFKKVDNNYIEITKEQLITELQKANEELENINEKMSLALESAEQKLDKAIDKITTEQLYTQYSWGKTYYSQLLKDLLEILKGGDKDGKISN